MLLVVICNEYDIFFSILYCVVVCCFLCVGATVTFFSPIMYEYNLSSNNSNRGRRSRCCCLIIIKIIYIIIK